MRDFLFIIVMKVMFNCKMRGLRCCTANFVQQAVCASYMGLQCLLFELCLWRFKVVDSCRDFCLSSIFQCGYYFLFFLCFHI